VEVRMTDGTLIMVMKVEIPTTWVEIPIDAKVESPLSENGLKVP
jgi:hypothetical protein